MTAIKRPIATGKVTGSKSAACIAKLEMAKAEELATKLAKCVLLSFLCIKVIKIVLQKT